MRRFMKLAIILSLVVSSLVASAQERASLSTENTKQACSDKIDNDGDGRVDCADQDCWDLVMCQQSTPATNPTGRKSGYTKMVLGAVLLPLGIVLGGVSAVPWVLSSGNGSDTQAALWGVAGTMDALALAGIASGTALLAIGVGDIAGSHDRRASLAPPLSGGRTPSLSISF
jgi:hypothetical protein